MVSTAQHDAVFFNGRSNRKRSVSLRFADGIDIIENGAVVETWPFDKVRRADSPTGLMRFSSESALPLARLEVKDTATQGTVEAYCRALDAGAASPGQTRRIVGWSLAAVCSILMLSFYGIPYAADRIAPLLPVAVEQRLGDAVDKQANFLFGEERCERADGQAAFVKLVDKLRTAGGMSLPLEAHVVRSKIPNAFALPGGRVYILDGLLQKAQNADEVAGVLAHELGHVQHRDGVRRIIQTGGTSFLIGLLFGDVTGSSAMVFVGRSMFDASYSRDQEKAADTFAIDTMHKLGRSPKPMGTLLVRVTGKEADKSLSLFASHPFSEDRLARMSEDGGANAGAPLLTAAEWKALKGICAK